jgi:hypothetical protein
VGRLAQFLATQLAEVLSKLGFPPIVQGLGDVLAVNPKSVSDVLKRRLAGAFSVVVDLDRDRAPLPVARLDLDPKQRPVPDAAARIAGQTSDG